MKKKLIYFFIIITSLFNCSDRCNFNKVRDTLIYFIESNKYNEVCMYELEYSNFRNKVEKYIVKDENKICKAYFYSKGIKNMKEISDVVCLTVCNYKSFNYPKNTYVHLEPLVNQSIRNIIRKRYNIKSYDGKE